MKKLLYIAACALIALTACQQELVNPECEGSDQKTDLSILANLDFFETDSETTPFDLDSDVATKAVANAVIRLNWTAGDKVSAINLTTGKALGGDLVAQESGSSSLFSGTLTGTINSGDRIAFLYPSQGYTKEQAFTGATIDLSQQSGISAVPLAVYGVARMNGNEAQNIYIEFKYLMSYYQINLANLPGSALIDYLKLPGMGATTTLTINSAKDGFVSTAKDAVLSVTASNLRTNDKGVKAVYISGFASPGKSSRRIIAKANGRVYSTRWSGANLSSGRYYAAVITDFQETVQEVSRMVDQTYQPYFFYGSSNQYEFDMSYAGLLITYARMTCDFVNNSATIGYDWWTGYTGSYGYNMSYNNSRQTVPFMSLYKIIDSANDIIGALSFSEDELSEDSKALLGMAYVYRALMYHDLYNMYLPAKNQYTDVSAVEGLTVPIIVSYAEEETEYKTARAPKEVLSAFVLADLDKAEKLLDGYTPVSGLYPSLAVVYGIKARMYMAIMDYANAASYARKAIETSGKTPMTEDQWTDPTKAFCDASGNNSWMWYYAISGNNMGNLCNPTGFLAGESDWGYNSLTQFSVQKWIYDRLNRSDFRKKSFIDPDREKYPADYYRWAPGFLDYYPFANLQDYRCFKIRCKEGDWMTYSVGGAIDFPMMRIEEMYLIEAEAVGMKDGEAAGAALLEKFMQTYRDPEYSYAEAKSTFGEGFVKSFQEEVLYQKRVEFLGEGVGFFDAKRIRPGLKTWYEGSNIIHPTVAYDIKEVSPYWNFVIPQSEIDSNVYIVREGESTTEINGVMTTQNNPDPTNKVNNVATNL